MTAKYKMKTIFTISIFIIFSIISFALYLSFRIQLLENLNISTTIYFIFFQIMVWGPFIFKKKLMVITNTLFFLVIANLLSTPFNYLLTFDLPYNPPNTKHIKDYENTKHFKNIFFGKHVITFDHMTYRTNKTSIDYNNKDDNVLRIFTIGGSTTAQVTLDDKKTWSSLIGKKLESHLNKRVEVINTGVLGFASPYHFLTLKKVEKYQPDLIVFLVGINDWNNHITRNKRNYYFTSFEINYDVTNSLIYKGFKNIKKQIKRKTSNFLNNKETKNIDKKLKKNNDSSTIFFNDENLWTENREYLNQIGSPNTKKKVRNFRPADVSQEYKFWIKKIINNCKSIKITCIFMDQPNAYKDDISKNLKSRLWMTPLFKDYTLPFEDLKNISKLYNTWLQKKVIKNNLHFVALSKKIPPNLNYFFDDVHLTENGSKRISDLLFDYIRENIDFN
jgi:lysophospholipase L1-like esterase